jgi:transglutaminase-like putative cysteine protease
MKNFLSGTCLSAFLFCLTVGAQLDLNYTALTIPKQLKENANAVVRQNDVIVEIEGIDLVTVTTRRLVTVFNELGMADVKAFQHYSASTKIRDMRAVVYDVMGEEITTIKERDFRDVSAVDGGTLYAENRVKFLEYTPRSYPLTIEYISEVDLRSTAFLPQWSPLEGFYCSTQSSTFKVVNPNNIQVKFKEENFEDFPIEKDGELSYEVNELKAIKGESYRPAFQSYAPRVKLAMEKFEMEGVEGSNLSWKDFGKWMYKDLVAEAQDLPEEVSAEIKQLTMEATNDKEKARIVYQYVQDRSRYISVQVGIGGWKPIDASEVHEMAYGDCKGLTNYTMALMKEVGVTSHYAAIYGGSEKRSLDPEFSMTEGNHVILYLPELENDTDYWLECTSKNAPFGYMSDFTDDRDALVIKPDGGEIKHTTSYPSSQNLQNTEAVVTINPDGSVEGEINLESKGVQYAWRQRIESLPSLELQKSYLELWDHLNGLRIGKATLEVDKDQPAFYENVRLSIDAYGSKTGNLLLFQPVMFNRLVQEPSAYEERLFDIEIERGYIDEDKYKIVLGDGIVVDALPDPVDLTTTFGSYSLTVVHEKENDQIVVHRKVTMNEGVFDKSEYEAFKDFRSEIVKHDSSRGVLKIN